MDQDIILADARCYPLNSKRLTVAHLQSIADALGLLKSSSSTDELRQMIDGKLADLHRESQNVQVAVLEESGMQIRLYLLDASGTFSQAQPFFRSQPSTLEQTDELQELQRAVEELRQQNQDLKVALEGQKREMDGLRSALQHHLLYVNKYLRYLFAAKWLSLQVVRVYYATPQVDKYYQRA